MELELPLSTPSRERDSQRGKRAGEEEKCKGALGTACLDQPSLPSLLFFSIHIVYKYLHIHTHGDLHSHTYMDTHWALTLSSIYVHKHNHMRLFSYLHTHAHTHTFVRQVKTKLPLECLRLPLSRWTPFHREIQIGGREITPHLKLPSGLWKGFNIGWLVWIGVSRTLESLRAPWEAISSFGVRSYRQTGAVRKCKEANCKYIYRSV